MSKIYKFILKLIKNNPGFIVVSIIYLISFLAMLPLRDQAFEDDFAYIHTVRHFVDTGELKISEWVAPTTVFIAFWGLIFSKIFGYSISTLHFSNVFLTYFGILSFYLLLKRFRLSEYRSAFFSLFLSSYPFVFQFSYSVMSDTFHMSLLCISLYLFVKGFQDNSSKLMFLASIFSGFTFLTRQLGITLPISIFIILTYDILVNKKGQFKQILYAIFPFTIIVSIYYIWLNHVGMTIGMYVGAVQPLKNQILPALFPLHFKDIYASNSLYLESFVKRPVFYLNNSVPFLFPIFLIFKYRSKKTLAFFLQNYRKIFIGSLFIVSLYALNEYLKLNKSTWIIPSSILLVYDQILRVPTWNIIWIKLIFISIIPWLIIFPLSLTNIFSTIFEIRKPLRGVIIKIIFPLITIYSLITIVNMFNVAYPFIADSFFSPFNPITNSLKLALLDLKNYWFFLFVTSLIFSFIAYAVKSLRFRRLNPEQLGLVFISLNFVFTLIFILIASKNMYAEYIISFIPFLIFLVAIITKRLEVNKFISVSIIFLMFIFSWQITRGRYQTQGYDWELGVRIVEKGVNPYGLDVNWAWRPYWFFESTIQDVIKEYGGDKYAVPWERMRSWYYGPAPQNQPKYITVYKGKPTPTFDQNDIIIDGGYFKAFFWEKERKTYVVIKKAKQ